MFEAEVKMSDSRGFTLVEVAIVLVIVGLLVGVGSSMVGVLSTAVMVRQTKDTMDAVAQSVTSWASSNNDIPNVAGFSSAAKSPVDAWGRSLVYLYDSNLYAATPTKDTICGRRSAAITVVTTDPVATINNVAFAVLSSSDDATFASTLTGTGNLNGGALSTLASGSITGSVSVNANNSDIVRWVTLDELRSKIGCQGSPLKILNNDLPSGSASSSTYSATIVADGGVQYTAPDSYSWCVQTATVNQPPATLTFQKPNASGVATPITTVANLFQTNCSAYPVASWPKAGQLMLSGTPSPSASYYLTVYVSDNNANTVSKPFVLTANP
jgi:prepilin-type N-terminal cleavage/methylation domain-containing protein